MQSYNSLSGYVLVLDFSNKEESTTIEPRSIWDQNKKEIRSLRVYPQSYPYHILQFGVSDSDRIQEYCQMVYYVRGNFHDDNDENWWNVQSNLGLSNGLSQPDNGSVGGCGYSKAKMFIG